MDIAGFKEASNVLGKIFRDFKYILTIFIGGFLFYFLNGLIFAVPNIKSFYQTVGLTKAAKLVFIASLSPHHNLTQYALYGLLILSFLVGILISLLIYRYKLTVGREHKRGGFLGAVGFLLGVAAPGCAACGVGLLALLGFSSALFALPFEGKEVIAGAIVLVGFSIYRISRKLYNPTCKIKTNSNQMKGGKNE